MTSSAELDLVRWQLDKRCNARFLESFSESERAEYDRLTDRETELLSHQYCIA